MFYGQRVNNSGSSTTVTSTSGGSGTQRDGINLAQIFPNPCSNSLTLSSHVMSIVSYTIYDEHQNLKLNVTSRNEIQSGVSVNLPQGKYFINIQLQNGTSGHQFIKTDNQPLFITTNSTPLLSQ